ncbi:hypothetical protein HDU93_003295, partial [Gonapodya sp. JEL0774]
NSENQQAIEQRNNRGSTREERTVLQRIETAIVGWVMRNKASFTVRAVFKSMIAQTAMAVMISVPIQILLPQEDFCHLESRAYYFQRIIGTTYVVLAPTLLIAMNDIRDLHSFQLTSSFDAIFLLLTMLFYNVWLSPYIPESITREFPPILPITIYKISAVVMNTWYPAWLARKSYLLSTAHAGSLGESSDKFKTFAYAKPGDPTWEAFCSFAARDFCGEIVTFIEAYDELMFKVGKALSADPVASSPAALQIESQKIVSSRPFTSNEPGDIQRPTSFKRGVSISSNLSSKRSRYPPTWSLKLGLRPGAALPVPAPTVPHELHQEYRNLYEHFLSPSAVLPLNVPFDMVQEVKSGLDEPEWTVDLFDPIRASVLELLHDNTYRKWIDLQRS